MACLQRAGLMVRRIYQLARAQNIKHSVNRSNQICTHSIATTRTQKKFAKMMYHIDVWSICKKQHTWSILTTFLKAEDSSRVPVAWLCWTGCSRSPGMLEDPDDARSCHNYITDHFWCHRTTPENWQLPNHHQSILYVRKCACILSNGSDRVENDPISWDLRFGYSSCKPVQCTWWVHCYRLIVNFI